MKKTSLKGFNESTLRDKQLLWLTALSFVTQLIYVMRFISLSENKNFALILFSVVILIPLPTLAYKYYKNYLLMAGLVLFLNTSALVFHLYISGGIYAPGLAWLLVLPPIYGIILGRRFSFYGAGMSFLIVICFAMLRPYSAIPAYFLKRELLFHAQLINNLFLICFSLIAFIVFNGIINRYQKNNESKLHEIDMLLKVILHDVCNPLSSLKFNHEKMNRTLGDQITQNLQFKRMGKSLLSLELIIDQVRNMRLLAHKGLKPTLVPMNLDSEIEFCLDLFNDDMARKNIAYNARLTLANQKVMCDPNIFKFEILSNILSNAIKYSPKESAIEIKSFVDDEHLCVQVIDCGKGISQDVIESVMNGTNPMSCMGTEGETGQGFGLAITKQFIELVGGNIIITSPFKNELGTSVELKLPLH